MRKSVFSLLALVLLLAFAVPAAAEVAEVTTFGYTDERRRASEVAGECLRPIIWEEKGKSYSQPLILDGARWGKKDKIMVVAVMDNKTYGYVLPKEPEPKHWQELWMNVEPAFVVPLSGTKPTASHPTFYEKNGRKYLFIGTYSEWLDIIDITTFGGTPQKARINTYPATDITGAPLILNWRGHDIVVATSGNADRVNLISDPLATFEGRKPHVDYISVPGRTSSSPAPINIDGKVGFVIGVDQGRNAGQIRVYYLDDLFVEENGRAVLKSRDAAIVAGTYDGIAASFSVSECGTVVFFGGTRSHIYAFNVKQGKFAWMNTDHVGIFSNRSPALHEDKLYFPAVGEYRSGRLVALDKGTGRTVWDWDAVPAEGDTVRPRVQTAPVVEDIPGWGKVVLAGLSNGHIAVLPADTGDWVKCINLLSGYLAEHRPPPDNYAWGISGEISSCDHWMFVTNEIGLFGYMRDVYDYKAVSIDSGVPEGELAKPGQTYTGTVVFGFDGSVQDEHLPVGVGVTQDGQYLYKMHNGADVCEITKLVWRAYEKEKLFPWEKPSEHFQIRLVNGQRTYHFEWTAPHGQSEVELTAFINLPIPPVQVPIWLSGEFDWENNKVSVKVPVEGQVVPSQPPPQGNATLTFQAVSRTGDLRPPNTAKWTDLVTATLKPPKPNPIPMGCGNVWIEDWKITKAVLKYPKANPDATFGHYQPPIGTVPVEMDVSGKHVAKVQFYQNWSTRGAPIWDFIREAYTNELFPPDYYTITVEYTIWFKQGYMDWDRDCTGRDQHGKCIDWDWDCEVVKYHTDSFTKTVSGKLLVDGVGTVVLSQ